VPAAPSAQTPRTLTRDDLVRAGQSGRPWDFLPLAAQALDQIQGDHALRFLTAANLARLGLRTLANEQLALLPDHPDVNALRAAVARLPDDTVVPPRCLHLGALQLDNIQPTHDCFKTLDGNLITRPRTAHRAAEPSAALRTTRFINQHAHAKALLDQVRQRSAADLSRIVLHGLSAPLFKALYDATPTSPIGFAPRIIIAQHDPAEFLEQLAITDLTGELNDPRVELYIGPDATTRLAAKLRERTPYALPTIVLPSPTLPTPCTPSLPDTVSAALTHQHTEFEQLTTALTTRYAERDATYWRECFGTPPSPSHRLTASPSHLRILLPTSRFSTYVQHAAHDLAAALTRAGHRAQVLIEPDAHTELAANAYLRAIDELDPDLIITINYPRACLARAIPPRIPYIAWLQDAMPHLFRAELGRAQTDFDFIAGHTFADLFLRHEYPTDRLLPIALVADPHKFHRGPVAPDLARKHTCDIAFVSHHAETPRAMFERLRAEMRHNPGAQRAFDALWPEIQAAASECAHTCHHLRLRNAARDRLRNALGREPDSPADQDTLHKIYQHAAIPLADRLIRHEALEWAAAIARRRNLRFHLYGKHWDRHPTLAEFARGELPHNDELRASYRCAGVHLHLSGTALVHQRVVECYLAGGLCIPRLFRDAHAGLRTAAELATIDRTPDHVDTANARVGYEIANHPEFHALADHLARLGHPHEGPIMWFPTSRRENQRRLRNAMAPDHNPAFLFGDLADTTFQTEAQLEALITRALTDQAWRVSVTDRVTKVAREHLTTDALAQRMLELVATSFNASLSHPTSDIEHPTLPPVS